MNIIKMSIICYDYLWIITYLRVITEWNGVSTDTLGVAISKPKNADELGTCNFIENYFICEQVYKIWE